MGTLVYIVAHLAGYISEDADLVNICYLISIDFVALALMCCARSRGKC